MDKETLDRERNQLIEHWRQLFEGGRNPFSREGRGSAALNHLFGAHPTPMNVRKFHDKLGWCAGYGKNCKGAVYRTKAFMQIPVGERVGNNPNGRVNSAAPRQNIHIEHTVQATQFCNELWCNNRSADYNAALRYLIKYTPTAAMTYCEKNLLGQAERGRHRNEALDQGIFMDLPFARYRVMGNPLIWDIFNGQLVDIRAYSFDEHINTIRALVNEVGGPANLF